MKPKPIPTTINPNAPFHMGGKLVINWRDDQRNREARTGVSTSRKSQMMKPDKENAMTWLDVQAIEINAGQLVRINDTVRFERMLNADTSQVYHGTVNEITVYGNCAEVAVTTGGGEEHNIDIDQIDINETQGW